MREITFEECPRPQLVREGWKCLDGTWGFCFDPDNKGETQGYAHGFEKEYDILVPFAYQSRASGIGLEKRCDNVWYARTLTVEKRAGRRYVLHLEGADWRVKVYVNRQLAGTDSGGYHRMSFDITNCLHAGDNLLVIKCEDSYSAEQPRGKQRREDVSRGCFYVDTTGIWKTVWLEETGTDYITGVSAEPSLADGSVLLRIGVHAEKGVCLETRITYAGNGEPTSHPQFLSVVMDTCALRDKYFPQAKVCLLTNATHLDSEDVRRAVELIDRPCLKLDAVDRSYIERVNRPNARYDLNEVTNWMKSFKGKCIIQTMFMKGTFEGQSVDNTTDEFVQPWVDMVEAIHPEGVDIYTLARDTPRSGLVKASAQELERIAGLLRERGIDVHCYS